MDPINDRTPETNSRAPMELRIRDRYLFTPHCRARSSLYTRYAREREVSNNGRTDEWRLDTGFNNNFQSPPLLDHTIGRLYGSFVNTVSRIAVLLRTGCKCLRDVVTRVMTKGFTQTFRRVPTDPTFDDYTDEEEVTVNNTYNSGGENYKIQNITNVIKTRTALVSSTMETSRYSDAADTEPKRCCICLGHMNVRYEKPTMLLPCSHNNVVHIGCAWDWVCCHSSSNPAAGFYHIICPMCRSAKSTQLISYHDLYSDGVMRRRRALR